MNRHSHRKEKNISQSNGTIMAAAMAVTVYPVPAFAEEGQNVAQKVQVLDKTGGTFMIMEKPEMIRQHRMWMNPQLLQILMY